MCSAQTFKLQWVKVKRVSKKWKEELFCFTQKMHNTRKCIFVIDKCCKIIEIIYCQCANSVGYIIKIHLNFDRLNSVVCLIFCIFDKSFLFNKKKVYMKNIMLCPVRTKPSSCYIGIQKLSPCFGDKQNYYKRS